MPPPPTSARSSCARSASACTWRTRSRASRPAATIGAFCMQHGPGTENAYRRRRPVLRRVGAGAGAAAGLSAPDRQHRPELQLRHGDARVVEDRPSRSIVAAEVANILRRAFTKLRNGRGGPVIVEIPTDMWNEEVPEPLNYTPVLRTRYGPDPVHVQGGRGAARRGEAPGDLCRPGRALRPGLAAAAQARRAAGDARDHQPRRQDRPSRRPIRCRSARAASRCRARCRTSWTTPT